VKPLKPQCDGWCDYPVANRPPAIRDFFLAAKKDPDMIKGAWVYMLECDYVWARPVQASPAMCACYYHFVFACSGKCACKHACSRGHVHQCMRVDVSARMYAGEHAWRVCACRMHMVLLDVCSMPFAIVTCMRVCVWCVGTCNSLPSCVLTCDYACVGGLSRLFSCGLEGSSS
jgi:hypothetical protein